MAPSLRWWLYLLHYSAGFLLSSLPCFSSCLVLVCIFWGSRPRPVWSAFLLLLLASCWLISARLACFVLPLLSLLRVLLGVCLGHTLDGLCLLFPACLLFLRGCFRCHFLLFGGLCLGLLYLASFSLFSSSFAPASFTSFGAFFSSGLGQLFPLFFFSLLLSLARLLSLVIIRFLLDLVLELF